MMYPRTEYEMTQVDLDKILDACRPVPMIALHLGTPRSAQENANDAWAELGSRMGFDAMTVRPSSRGDRFFTAVPSETSQNRSERLAREAEEKRTAEVAQIESEIVSLQSKLATLREPTP